MLQELGNAVMFASSLSSSPAFSAGPFFFSLPSLSPSLIPLSLPPPFPSSLSLLTVCPPPTPLTPLSFSSPSSIPPSCPPILPPLPLSCPPAQVLLRGHLAYMQLSWSYFPLSPTSPLALSLAQRHLLAPSASQSGASESGSSSASEWGDSQGGSGGGTTAAAAGRWMSNALALNLPFNRQQQQQGGASGPSPTGGRRIGGE